MEEMKKLIDDIKSFESLVSTDIQNKFYFEIKNLIETVFREDQSRKHAYLEDLKFYHNFKHGEATTNGNSLILRPNVKVPSRILYNFAQLLFKIQFNTELDILIEKYSENNRIEKDLLDCYRATYYLCSLKFLLPSENHHKHKSEIEANIKLLKYNDEKLIKKLGIHFTCKTKPDDVWNINTDYEITINKLYIYFSMIGDHPHIIQMNIENKPIINLADILEFLDSIKQKLLENRIEKDKKNDKILEQIDTRYTIMNDFIYRELKNKFKMLKLSLKFQKDFFRVLNYFVNKLVYNNNHKDFLQDYVEEWYEKNKDLSRKEMETKCFHPKMREYLKGEFGEEIVDTPDEARGHIDLKLSFTIPIELKVLKDKKGRKKEDNRNALDLLENQHLIQIKSEIINSLVGFLVGLDFRQKINRDLTIMPHPEYMRLKWIKYPQSRGLIIFIVFLANKKPSSI